MPVSLFASTSFLFPVALSTEVSVASELTFNQDSKPTVIKPYKNNGFREYIPLTIFVLGLLSTAFGATVLMTEISDSIPSIVVTILSGTAILSVGLALYFGRLYFDVKRVRVNREFNFKKPLYFALAALAVLITVFILTNGKIDDFRDFWEKKSNKFICLTTTSGLSLTITAISYFLLRKFAKRCKPS